MPLDTLALLHVEGVRGGVVIGPRGTSVEKQPMVFVGGWPEQYRFRPPNCSGKLVAVKGMDKKADFLVVTERTVCECGPDLEESLPVFSCKDIEPLDVENIAKELRDLSGAKKPDESGKADQWLLPSIWAVNESGDGVCVYVIDYATGQWAILGQGNSSQHFRPWYTGEPPAKEIAGLWCSATQEEWEILAYDQSMQGSSKKLVRGPIDAPYVKKAIMWKEGDELSGILLRRDGRLFRIKNTEFTSLENEACTPVDDFEVRASPPHEVYAVCGGTVYKGTWNEGDEGRIAWTPLPSVVIEP